MSNSTTVSKSIDEELNYKVMLMMSKMNETSNTDQPQTLSKTLLNNTDSSNKLNLCSNFEPHYWR
jgi:hypothetical protein